MSNDSLLSIALCCLSCTSCCTQIAEIHQDYHVLPSTPANTTTKPVSVKAVYDYQLSNPLCVKNEDGKPCCVICRSIIIDNKTTLIQCETCKRLIAHPICFMQHDKKCPLCTKTF